MRIHLLAIAGLLAGLVGAHAQDAAKTYTSDQPYEDVAASLEDAVVNRGYVIDYHGQIGDMLTRTAVDVGAEKPLYSNAEFIQFCSAVVSRKAMEEDLSNIAFCPYVLFVYEAEEKPGEIVVGYRPLPAGPGRDEVNTLLDEIAQEAAEGF